MNIHTRRIGARAALAACLVAGVAGTGYAVPRMGLYFDGHPYYRPEGSFVFFEGQLLLHDADTLVSAVEYALETPFDPSHSNLILVDVTYPEDFSITLGDPWTGHSISYWPPLDGHLEYNLLCTFSFLMIQGCDQVPLYDAPITVGPSPDSGYLRGTSYPGHVLFDIMGETSYLCPGHWPPELDSVTVCSPRTLRAWFNQCVYNWEQSYNGVFALYTTLEPHDTIDVLCATKNATLDPPGDDFFVYLVSPMQEGVGYTLRAEACCECNGCATSTKSFVYEGGLPDAPDLAVTFWSSHENYFDPPDGCTGTAIGYVVRNVGALESGPFLLRVTAGPYGSAEAETVWSDSCGGLSVDGALEGTVSVILPYIPAYYCALRFEADCTDLVDEPNEEDNRKEAQYSLPRPEISSILDVPGDYGFQVELTFLGSQWEINHPDDDDLYRVFRWNGLEGAGWEEVHQLAATSVPVYTCIVPTAVDSSGGTEDYWTTFTVRYDLSPTSSYTYLSCPDSGYSVDDLGPIGTLLLASSVEAAGEAVLLRWSVSSSEGLDGFIVSRARTGGAFDTKGSLPAVPGGTEYEFEDRSAGRGVEYVYRVEWLDGERPRLLFETEPTGLPSLPLALRQNRPNPFNPSTEITFSLPGPSTVAIDIYDVSGKRVRRLLDGHRPAGLHSVVWDGLGDDGAQAASGVYFYRLTAGRRTLSRKMVLLR